MAEHDPAEGDVLITRRRADGRFEISIVPGGAQLHVQHKFQAIQHAHRFAEQTGAAVWFTESGESYTRVEKPKQKES